MYIFVYMKEKYKVLINMFMSQIDDLVDEKSEIRYTGSHKKYKILVDVSSPPYNYIKVQCQKDYIQLSQLTKNKNDTSVKMRSFGRVALNLNDTSKVSEHINGNPFDNRLCNLRICNQGQNVKNKRGFSKKSQYKGLHKNAKTGIITVEIQNEFERKRVIMSSQFIERVAAVIYDYLAIKNHGEYGRLNFNKDLYTDSVITVIESILLDKISIAEKEH